MSGRRILGKARQLLRPGIAGLAVGVTAFAVLWNIQYASPAPLGSDIYYHLKFADITSRTGIIKDFPWCQFSIFKDHFADKDFLFHILLVPFVRYDLHQAAKLFPIFIGAAFVVCLFWILLYHRVVYPWLWLILFFCWTPTFLYRFAMPRPHLVAIFAFVLMMHALMAQRRVLLFAVCCLYPLAHSMAFLVWGMALLYELNRFRVDRRFEWRTLAIVFAGLAIGFAVHPNFPNNVRVLFIQAVRIPQMLWFGQDLRFGMEFRPFDTRAFLIQSYLPLALNAVALYVTFTRRYDLDRALGFVLAVNLGVFLVTMLSRRFVEFLVPVNIIFLGMVFSRAFTEESLESFASRIGVRRLLGATILVSGFLVLSAYSHYDGIVQSMKQNRPTSYRAAALWLRQHAEPGEIVYTADWDDMPQLFFYNERNRYLNVLDPAFMYCWNPEVWREWRRIGAGMNSDNYRGIREGFDSRYVFATADEQRLIGALVRDPRFEMVHSDQNCVLFRLRDDDFEFFLRDWTIAGPFDQAQDQNLVADAGSPDSVFRLGLADAPTTLPVRFRKAEFERSRFGFVDLSDCFRATSEPLTNVCAYARATFHSPTSGTALLHLGFDDGGSAWLNGKTVFQQMRPGSAVPNEHVVPVDLVAGKNTLDVKVYQLNQEWGLYAHLSDMKDEKCLYASKECGEWRAPFAQPAPAETTPTLTAEIPRQIIP